MDVWKIIHWTCGQSGMIVYFFVAKFCFSLINLTLINLILTFTHLKDKVRNQTERCAFRSSVLLGFKKQDYSLSEIQMSIMYLIYAINILLVLLHWLTVFSFDY